MAVVANQLETEWQHFLFPNIASPKVDGLFVRPFMDLLGLRYLELTRVVVGLEVMVPNQMEAG